MDNEKITDKYKSELLQLLSSLEKMLKGISGTPANNLVKQVYSIVHKINQTAVETGLNYLSNLFAPIEKKISAAIEQKQTLEQPELTIIISAAATGQELTNDSGLNRPGMKTAYENIKKTILSAFSAETTNEQSSFSNSRFEEIFKDEAIDLINQLEEKLLQLEGTPDDPALIDNVFRIMHTLKGNSNMFGHKYLGEITHHLENVYDGIRSHKFDVTRQILEITLQCIDHFRNLIDDPELSDTSNKVIQESILSDITEISESDNNQSAPEAKIGKIAGGVQSFYIFFKPNSDIFKDGTNPLYYVYDLNDLGDCLILPVLAEALQLEKIEPEKCYMSWHILLVTKETKETIGDNFMFLNENSQPDISIVSKTDVLKDKQFIDKFMLLSTKPVSIASDLAAQAIAEAKTEEKNSVKSKTTAADASVASIRVASAKVDLMMNLISELVTKQAELSMLANNQNNAQLLEVAESIESISRDLRDNAFSISLIPLEKTVLRFQRLVRDVAAKFNKKVNFIVEGKETELDKTIIEKIVDPIMHILRNSIDHGIETPDQRLALGKPEIGEIKLKAYPSGAHVVIEITDDGSGINVEKVRKTAVKKGYIGASDELSTDHMLKLILSPGFSTADNVSEVSGRGVGMDVVHQKIKEIRGELEIYTQENKGTTLIIRLPLTISIIDSLLVLIGSTYYLIPLAVVQRCAEVKTQVITESPVRYLNLDGEYIPFVDLHKEFDIKEERADYQRLIMLKHKNMLIALVVDHIIGNHQAVLKALGQAYRKQEVVSGASILGNGEVALVLDTNKLLQEYMSEREVELERLYKQSIKV
ncbi:MAG: chemotaxis protein CheA [Bacteroidales bacterium]|nr:chemotaxis protein CheA [Bacteroidales bacterium]